MKRIAMIACAVAAIAATTALPTSPANAAIGNETVGSGSIIRATFYQNSGYGGFVYEVKGTTNCTSSKTDADHSQVYVGNDWNDKFSSGKDSSSCNTKVYNDNNYGGTTYGYFSMGSGTDFTAIGWNDKVSSFKIS